MLLPHVEPFSHELQLFQEAILQEHAELHDLLSVEVEQSSPTLLLFLRLWVPEPHWPFTSVHEDQLDQV